MTAYIVRPAHPADAFLLAPLHNGCQEAHFHTTAAKLSASIREHPDRLLVAEQGGQPVGSLSLWHPDFHPQHVWLGFALHPDHRESGVAAELFRRATTLAQGRPLAWTSVRADYLSTAPDLTVLGFREVHRTFGGGFYLGGTLPDTSVLEARLLERGVSIVPAALLQDEPRLEAFYQAVRDDKATAAPTIPVANDQLHDPDSLWDAAFVAIRDGEILGLALPERAGLGAWNAALLVRSEAAGAFRGPEAGHWDSITGPDVRGTRHSRRGLSEHGRRKGRRGVPGRAAPTGRQHRARLDRLRGGAGVKVQDAVQSDAPALARLLTAAYLGQWTSTPEQTMRRIGTPAPGRLTLCAVQAGEVLAGLDADPFSTMPGGLRVQLYGDSAAFTPLYLEALTRAAGLGFRQLLSVVRQDHRPQVEFLSAAGFRNAYQSWGAHLELKTFDFAPYRALEEKHYLEGTEVQRYGPDRGGALRNDAPWEALHALYTEGLRDTPRNPTTTHDSASLEYFRSEVAAGQVFAAVHRGEVLSYTALGLNAPYSNAQGLNAASVDSEHTATRRASRGRGLATLVKASALAWAREAGYTLASTGGNVANLPMLRVNTRLGYRPEPMWLTWVRQLPAPMPGELTSPA